MPDAPLSRPDWSENFLKEILELLKVIQQDVASIKRDLPR